MNINPFATKISSQHIECKEKNYFTNVLIQDIHYYY